MLFEVSWKAALDYNFSMDHYTGPNILKVINALKYTQNT